TPPDPAIRPRRAGGPGPHDGHDRPAAGGRAGPGPGPHGPLPGRTPVPVRTRERAGLMLREDHLIPMVGEGWARYLLPYFQTPETLRLIQFVAQERKRFNVYPSKEDVFKAFRL